MLLADGFEDAYVGVAYVFNRAIAVYDLDKCIEVLIKRDGMGIEEATEYFEFNVLGAYMGKDTPAFLERLTLEETIERIQEA
jgi:hypothetical protein